MLQSSQQKASAGCRTGLGQDSESPWQAESYQQSPLTVESEAGSFQLYRTSQKELRRICSLLDELEPSTKIPAYPLEAEKGLTSSQIAVMVWASRPPIRPVVPKAKGNQTGMPRKVGLA